MGLGLLLVKAHRAARHARTQAQRAANSRTGAIGVPRAGLASVAPTEVGWVGKLSRAEREVWRCCRASRPHPAWVGDRQPRAASGRRKRRWRTRRRMSGVQSQLVVAAVSGLERRRRFGRTPPSRASPSRCGTAVREPAQASQAPQAGRKLALRARCIGVWAQSAAGGDCRRPARRSAASRRSRTVASRRASARTTSA